MEELPEILKEREGLYTAEDKIKYLLEKYPIVSEIKEKLDLDTSF